MPGAATRRQAYILLLGPGHDRAARQVLRSEAPGALVVEPPVTGVGFFAAAGEEGRELDRWYRAIDLGGGPPSILVWHEPDLGAWLHGADAEFWIATPDHATIELYRGLPNVHAVATWDARDLAHVAAAAAAPGEAYPPAPPAPPAERRGGSLGSLRRLFGLAPSRPAPSPPGVGALLVAAPPFSVAFIGGPAGSACALALATVLGEAVRPVGRTVALVDGRRGDPEAWVAAPGHGAAPSLQALITALREARTPPRPAFGGSPTLLVYPDERPPDERLPDERLPAEQLPDERPDTTREVDVQRAAAYLREQHQAVVVDLAPVSPDAVDSAAAAWLAACDLTVIVAAPDAPSLAAAHAQLSAEPRGARPVVLVLLGPAGGDPDTGAPIAALRARATRFVDLSHLEHGAGSPAWARLAEVVIELSTGR